MLGLEPVAGPAGFESLGPVTNLLSVLATEPLFGDFEGDLGAGLALALGAALGAGFGAGLEAGFEVVFMSKHAPLIYKLLFIGLERL